MKKWILALCLLIPGAVFGAAGVQNVVPISSGTGTNIDAYDNADGARRQAITIGDFSSSDTLRVDTITGIPVRLSTSALTTSGAVLVVTTQTIPVSGTFFQGTQPVSFSATSAATVTPGTGTFPVSGTFFQVTQPVSFGASQIATVTPGTGTFSTSLGAGSIVTVTPGTGTYSVTGTVAATQSGTWTTQVGNTQNTVPIQVISTNTVVQGFVASSATNSGSPVKIGVVVSTAVVTKVGMGSVTDLRGTASGVLLATLDCPRENIVKSSITITQSTTETVILSSGATGVYNDALMILVTNTSATAVRVDFRSGGGPTAGTIDFPIYVPAGDQRGYTTAHPWPQTLAAANWTAQVSATITDIRIAGIFCKTQ